MNIYSAQVKLEQSLLRLGNVQGVGVGKDKAGRRIIKVYVRKRDIALRGEIPQRLAGFPVEIVEIGDVKKA